MLTMIDGIANIYFRIKRIDAKAFKALIDTCITDSHLDKPEL